MSFWGYVLYFGLFLAFAGATWFLMWAISAPAQDRLNEARRERAEYEAGKDTP